MQPTSATPVLFSGDTPTQPPQNFNFSGEQTEPKRCSLVQVEMMTFKIFKLLPALSTMAVFLLKTVFVHLQVLRTVLKLYILHQNSLSSRKELDYLLQRSQDTC